MAAPILHLLESLAMAKLISLESWSTDLEAPRHRLDAFAAMLSSVQAPVELFSLGHEGFEAHINSVSLETITVVHQKGAPLRCREDRLNQGRATSRNYHLLLSLSTAWDAEHQGSHHCEPGDAMLFDAALPWKISHVNHYEVLNIKMPDAWLRQWVPSPAVLVGRPFRGDAGWGKALTCFAAQLTPGFFVDAPLPHSVLIDHLGALLALAASQVSGRLAEPPSPSSKSLASRVSDCIEQRAFEPGLTAQLVAQSVGISVRTLHRCLASEQKSFAQILVAARSDAAIRMLSSPIFRRLTIAEIARRAGFIYATHFSRVLRSRTGKSPSELRRSFGTAVTGSKLLG